MTPKPVMYPSSFIEFRKRPTLLESFPFLPFQLFLESLSLLLFSGQPSLLGFLQFFNPFQLLDLPQLVRFPDAFRFLKSCLSLDFCLLLFLATPTTLLGQFSCRFLLLESGQD